MSTATPGAASADRLSLYRAIWRWHFFAGLLSIPFLVILAVTGSLYLFKSEINHTVFAYRTVVADPGTPPESASTLVARAEAAVPGAKATTYASPATATDSVVVTLKGDEGKKLVYLNPYDGAVLAVLDASAEPMQVIKKIHSLEYFGTYTNRLIEAAAGFCMMLVVTGIYLWWPRGQSGGVVSVRGTPRQRRWWRDVHAVTGAFAGTIMFFLAITGMPWSGVWGAKVGEYADSHGLGYPAQLWNDVPTSTIPTSAVTPGAGWAVENAPVPLSTPAAEAAPIGIDKALASARTAGMAPGFDLALPSDETGVYTASRYFGDLSHERTIHIDQYSGKPLVDIAFKDYGPVGKAIEFGINVHQGMEWGRLNQFAMLATCLALIASSVTAIVMWWKRRPEGKIGVPPYPADPKVYRFLWIVAIVFGLAFPISGLAVLAMLAVDFLVIRTVPPLRRAFS